MARVQLIDPIESVSNLPNGIPDYENMFIFVELLANRRARSVIELNSNTNKTTLSTNFTDINVNMLGVDFTDNQKNSSRLTTNWTNNESLENPLEGFGITKIDININASYIPKINIEFTDIRGSAFFNVGDKSPYSVIFDFPPPLFKLSLKGYYGKSLDYDLHLVKHNTRFDSNTGNYITNAEFIARTFAPLADIPFKYVELVSLLVGNTDTSQPLDNKLQQSGNQENNNLTNPNKTNTSRKIPPRNTYELLEKIKNFTDELKKLKNTSDEAESFENAKSRLNDGREVVRFMNDFRSNLSETFRNNAKIIVKRKNNANIRSRSEIDDFRIVNGVGFYDNVINNSETSGNNSNVENTELFLGVKYSSIREGNINNDQTINTNTLIEQLLSFKKKLETKGSLFTDGNIKIGSIKEPVIIKNYNLENNVEKSQNNYDSYYALNVTKFYIDIKKSIEQKIDEVDELQTDLVNLINDKAEQQIGFRPTIYNIFKILCDDIDTFFRYMGQVSLESENHHTEYFDEIIDSVQENKRRKNKNDKKLYAFPLYTETVTPKGEGCPVPRKVRKIPPIDLSPSQNFPEVVFIDEFIDTLVLQKRLDEVNSMRTKVDSNGNNKWLPVNPADSVLSQNSGYNSPYANIDVSGSEDNIINSLYNRILNRYYILSQFSFAISFYSKNEKSLFFGWFRNQQLKRSELIEYLAKAEGLNLATSLINNNVLEKLKNNSKIYKNNVSQFYSDLDENGVTNYANISSNSLRLNDNQIDFYLDRTNDNFVGFEIARFEAVERINDTDANDPIEEFLEGDDNWFSNLIFPNNQNPIKKFTSENIPYFLDAEEDNDSIYKTKFLNGIEVIDDNQYRNLPEDTFFDYAEVLSTILAMKLDDFEAFINDQNISNQAKSFFLISLLGRARSYFSNFGEINVNFLNPAVVQVSRFSIYYMGGIVEYNTNDTFKSEIDDLVNNNELIRLFSISGRYIFDDASKMQKLSVNDAETFRKEFNDWRFENTNGYSDLISNYQILIDRLKSKFQENPDLDVFDRFDEILSTIKEDNYRAIDFQSEKQQILNYSELTFNNNTYDDVFLPLATTNQDTSGGEASVRAANDSFFRIFWETVANEIPEQEETLEEVEENLRGIVQDEDIKTQLYYSFKNISDKWISGNNTVERGFPLNNSREDSLISKFAFVDRAMNPIGDQVIINAEALVEMSKDNNLNMFQVFSRLLSLNGFEFFPLQNFISFKEGEWADTFRLFTNLTQASTPAFVCMYLGGLSSTLELRNSEFDNDGILDLQEEGLPDMNIENDCNSAPEVIINNQRELKLGESRFKYSQPKAFRVRFSEQNQSFFTDIEIEGKDFTETADSLAILSRIAGDGKTASPIPKGQNLFSIYENRAYEVTVTMLGNAMIQPTQYFQLENVPLYSGAYMIIDVSHNITPNHMTTTFKGVKILKYPNPFVSDFATSIGIESGTAEDVSGSRSVITNRELEERNQPISARAIPEKNSGLIFNEQFNLKISP